MIYEGLLLIGGVGLLAQTVLGFAHFGGAHTGHHLQGGDLHGHVHVHMHLGSGQSHGGHQTAPHTESAHSHTSGGKEALSLLWALFSPLTIFSVCLGAGASGLAAQSATRNALLVAFLSVLGGVLFYAALVRPIWGLIFAFASKPAENLAGVVARDAEAVSCFDKQGRGIVRVTLDGQFVRLLARLETDDLTKAALIVPGEQLVITSVDGKRNTCTVARL